MNTMRKGLLAACLLLSSPVLASGMLEIVAMIDRVEFEPGAEAPETVRVFGAFAYFDGQGSERSGFTEPVRGYLYFRLPSRGDADVARREWADLAAVAGTGEAVAFGSYGYIGHFDAVAADIPSNTVDGRRDDGKIGYPLGLGMGVQDASVPPSAPAEYSSAGIGVVRLQESNYPSIVAELKALLDE
jgi:hypothetical protein